MLKKIIKRLAVTLFVIFVMASTLMVVFTIVEIVEYGHMLGFNGYITMDMCLVWFILAIITAVITGIYDHIYGEED